MSLARCFRVAGSALAAVATVATGVALSASASQAAPATGSFHILKPLSQNPLNLVMTNTDGSAVRLGTNNNDATQQWRKAFAAPSTTAPGFNTFTFTLRDSIVRGAPKCLDVAGDSRQPLADIVVRPCDGTPSQRWVSRLDTPSKALQNEWSGLFVFQPTGPEFAVSLKQGLNTAPWEDKFINIK